ncbi:MAG: hypothetical protein CMH32_01240 [Micavibrio sp.]|jgi:hypothetical protein|nr:hypothetical protein [Micavibrio sp.]|tara:strand:+ start:191 stop:526 length:336 start_codon:yes stop_codon:yes gene_type:complete
MDIIGQYYAPAVKSKKERVRSKDRADAFDQASWDEYDIRAQRMFDLEKRLADVMGGVDDMRGPKTPVYRGAGSVTNMSAWIGQAAAEQDLGNVRQMNAVRSYETMSHVNDE